MNEIQITLLAGSAGAIIGGLAGALASNILAREREAIKAKKRRPFELTRAQFNQNEMDALRLIRSGKLTDSKHCPEACGLIIGGASWGHTVNLRLTEFGKMFLTAYDEE